MMSHWSQARNAAWQTYMLSAFTEPTHRALSLLSNLPNLHRVASAWMLLRLLQGQTVAVKCGVLVLSKPARALSHPS